MERRTKALDLHLTKFQAAKRQLNFAIKLFLQGEDEVAVHTLAAAACRVLRDIKEKQGPPVLSELLAQSIVKLASDIVSEKQSLCDVPNDLAEATQKVVEVMQAGELITPKRLNVILSTDQQKKFWRYFNETANFLKHADKDVDETMAITELDNEGLLDLAVACYSGLMGNEHTPETQAFTLFRCGADEEFAYTPIYRSEAGTALRRLPQNKRREFCLHYMQRLKQSTRH